MFGQYSTFIVPSYLVSAACLVGAVLLIRAVYRSRKRELAELEEEKSK